MGNTSSGGEARACRAVRRILVAMWLRTRWERVRSPGTKTDGVSLLGRRLPRKGTDAVLQVIEEAGKISITTDVQVRRVYDPTKDDDGLRVLVDHIWPRGMTKAKAALDEWCKDVSPSTELRKWYGHDPAKFDEFAKRYKAELEEPARAQALDHLCELANGQRLTLLTATKAADISEARVLADLIRR